MNQVERRTSAAAEALFGSEEISGYTRSASDALGLIVFGATSIALLALTLWAERSLANLGSAVVDLFGFVNAPIARVLSVIVQVGVVVVGVAIAVTAAWTRRLRLIGYLVLATVAAAGASAGLRWWLDGRLTATRLIASTERFGVDSITEVSVLAALVAAIVVCAPFVTSRWRTAAGAAVSLLIVMQIALSTRLSGQFFLTLSLGALSGTLVLYAFGRPNSLPSRDRLTAALRRVGIDTAAVQPATTPTTRSVPYAVSAAEGDELLVEVFGTNERAADLLYRLYRLVRYKNVGDERPFSSLRRNVEHEALVSQQARDAGVRAPRLRALAEVDADSMLLAFESVEGTTLDLIADDEVDDDLLVGIWSQLALLRRRGIAHRDLRRAVIVIDGEGQPWLTEFGFGEVAASDALLAADVAQLLVALAVKVGAERSVRAAVATLGADAIGSALPLLQMGALRGATRDALKEQPELLGELQAAVAELAGVEAPEFAQLERVSRKAVLTVAMLAAATYFLAPQVADMPGILREIGSANWALAPLIVLCSAVTYLGAAISMAGSVPQSLQAIPNGLAQLASSFAGCLAPSSLGGMALNVRFMQKQGVDPAVAVSGVGLSTVAGFVAHVSLSVFFVLRAKHGTFGSIEMPQPITLLYGAAAVVGVAVIAFAIPAVRHAVTERLFPILRRSVLGVAAVLRRPGKLAMLLGGSVLLTLAYLLAMYLSLRAFGGQIEFAELGALYLFATAVATAAPTPGGLGALEAALIAALVAAGIDKTVAVPAVFLYRLATYWLPILPGWFAMTWLRREDYV